MASRRRALSFPSNLQHSETEVSDSDFEADTEAEPGFGSGLGSGDENETNVEMSDPEPVHVSNGSVHSMPRASRSRSRSDASTLPSTPASTRPSRRPSTVPTTRPSRRPSALPSTLPSRRPSTLPPSNPPTHPSIRPSTRPSSRASTASGTREVSYTMYDPKCGLGTIEYMMHEGVLTRNRCHRFYGNANYSNPDTSVNSVASMFAGINVNESGLSSGGARRSSTRSVGSAGLEDTVGPERRSSRSRSRSGSNVRSNLSNVSRASVDSSGHNSSRRSGASGLLTSGDESGLEDTVEARRRSRSGSRAESLMSGASRASVKSNGHNSSRRTSGTLTSGDESGLEDTVEARRGSRSGSRSRSILSNFSRASVESQTPHSSRSREAMKRPSRLALLSDSSDASRHTVRSGRSRQSMDSGRFLPDFAPLPESSRRSSRLMNRSVQTDDVLGYGTPRTRLGKRPIEPRFGGGPEMMAPFDRSSSVNTSGGGSGSSAYLDSSFASLASPRRRQKPVQNHVGTQAEADVCESGVTARRTSPRLAEQRLQEHQEVLAVVDNDLYFAVTDTSMSTPKVLNLKTKK